MLLQKRLVPDCFARIPNDWQRYRCWPNIITDYCQKPMHDHFLQFIQLLNEEGVEYVVIDGFAVAKHGHPRYTGDLDILVSGTTGNAGKSVTVMLRFAFSPYDFAVDDFIGYERFVSIGDEPYKIELITRTMGITFEEAYTNRVQVLNQDVRIDFIGYSQRIANKLAVGRPKAIQDVEALKQHRSQADDAGDLQP